MSKFTKERIAEINTLTTATIPALITNGCTIEMYNEHRLNLNLHIIQALFGAEYKQPKKEGKDIVLKMKHHIADREEINEIVHIIDAFITNVEVPYFNSISNTDEADDMNIPVVGTGLPKLDKINNKHLSEYLFGNAGVIKLMLNGLDIVELSAVAAKVKKVNNRNIMIAIGVGTLVGLGIGAGIKLYTNSKKDDDVIEADAVEVDPDDIDVVDPDDIDVVDPDDAPTVELD